MQELTLRDVFTDCQGGMHSHGRLIKSLTKVYKGTSFEEFWEDFLRHLRFSLIVFKRAPAVERTVEFVAKFATSLCKKEQKKEQKKELDLAKDQDEEQEPEEEEMHPFLLKLFSFLLKHHGACDKGVRFRCCQLINKLLVSLGEDALIDDDLYDKIYECMLQRLKDKVPVVRVHSVLALTRLQDPQDRECPVISAYLFLLGCDPNPDVRRAVLSCIAATTKTLPAILERTRDTKDLVRKLAYGVIGDKIHVRAITIAQRVSLLQEGLNDRVESVRDACVNRLLQAWLRHFQGNILELLRCLDVENALDTANLMLAALFNKSPVTELIDNFDLLDKQLLLPIDELTCESALYWRSLCAHIASLGVSAQEQLEKILPTGTVLANYLSTVAAHMAAETHLEAQLRNDFILSQLLSLATQLDYSDEVGRREMDSVLRSLLLSEAVTHAQVSCLVSVVTLTQPDPDQRLVALVETISDIREPISTTEVAENVEAKRQRDIKLAGVRVQLNQLREDLEESIRGQHFENAATIKAKVTELEAQRQALQEEGDVTPSQEIRVEKNDPATLLKCLTIASEMLTDTAVRGLSPALQTLLEVLIIPGIQNADPSVRNAALRALGLCCLLSRDTAKAHLLLFMQVSQIDQESIKVTALRVIFDLLHMYGLETFQVDTDDNDDEDKADDEDETRLPEEEEEMEDDAFPVTRPEKATNHTAGSVLMILTTLLDSESSEVRTVTAEGLAKLLISGRVMSAKVMSRLLLLWYNPVTEDDAHLRHCLGAFFPIFAFAGSSNQQVLEAAFVPTLRTLFHAPATSPLAEVNANNVAELLCQLTNPQHLVNTGTDRLQDHSPHDSLAVSLCNEILSDPNSFNVRPLCRTLTLLALSPTASVTELHDLHTLSNRLVKEVKDKQCAKLLDKFQRVTSDLYTAASRLAVPPPGGEEGSQDVDVTMATVPGDQSVLREIDNTMATQEEPDPEVLPDNEGDTTGIRKLKRGKSRGKSMGVNTPASAVKTAPRVEDKTPASTKTKKSRKTKASKQIKEDSSDSEVPADTSVFASPAVTPVRRSARTNKTLTAVPADKPVTKAVRNTRKKLQELLSDTDSQASEGEATGKTRARGRRRRGTNLSDIENEAQ